MPELESPADRAGLFFDCSDLALFAEIEGAKDENGADVVIVERNVRCLFDRAFRLIGDSEGFHPTALCLDEDVTYLKLGHRLLLKGHVWEVEERQPDGTGFTQLKLELLGRYRFAADDVNVLAGFPYALPIILGAVPELFGDDPTTDPDAPRLAYPYTVSTHLDWDAGTHTLRE